MTTWQQAFWRAFYAWWLDGCPSPETWWWMRQMAEGVARFSRAIGLALLPSMQRATAALVRFQEAAARVDS